MNLIVEKDEKLESLPKRTNHHEDPDGCEYDTRYYQNDGYPYKRVNRWVVAQVGRHIDAITHDFVGLAWIPARKRTYSQLAEHLEVHTFWKKGKMFYNSRYSHEPTPIDYGNFYTRYDLLYLHPDTRILCRFQKKKGYFRRKAKEEATIKIIGAYHQFLKLEGNWYEVKARITQPGEPTWEWKGPHDCLIGEDNRWPNHYYYGYHEKRPGIRITVKRQLNKKELKAHGLKNDVKLPANAKICSVCGGWNCDPLRHSVSGKLSKAA